MQIGSMQQTPIVLFVLRDEDGDLLFLMHPDLRTLVQAADLEYIDSLLQDFVERAQADPAAIFKQLISLGVGPLVNRESGLDLSEFPPLQELAEKFVPL